MTTTPHNLQHPCNCCHEEEGRRYDTDLGNVCKTCLKFLQAAQLWLREAGIKGCVYMGWRGDFK